jgi:hypothetical protein
MSNKNKNNIVQTFTTKKMELSTKLEEAKEVNQSLTLITPLADDMNKSQLKDIIGLIPKLFQNIWIMWWISPKH